MRGTSTAKIKGKPYNSLHHRGHATSVEHQPAEDTLGVLLPEEMVEKYGLKEGDAFELVDTDRGVALYPLSEALAARMAAAELNQKEFKAVVQDFTKLLAP